MKRFRGMGGLALTLAAFALLLAGFGASMRWAGGTASREQAEVLETALRRAVVSCYAIEGRYPDTLARVTEDYGVVIDRGRFHVEYSAFASNLMPVIKVLVRGEGR